MYIYIYEPGTFGVYLTTCCSLPYEILFFFLYTLTYTILTWLYMRCHSRANSFTQR